MLRKSSAARVGAFFLVVLASACLVTPDASATVTRFSDRTAFNNAISIDSQIDFNSLDIGSLAAEFPIGNAKFVSTNLSGLFISEGFGLPGQYLSASNLGAIQIDLVPGIVAIGFDVSRLKSGSSSFSFALSDATTSIASSSLTVGHGFSFVGFSSDMGDIRHIVITNTASFKSDGFFEAIDNVTLGRVEGSISMSEPGALSLFGLGLLGLGVARRRKAV
ncbi:MAG: PEP-CTERM sorting domain-containing protein [Rhodospirillales bacterium]|nr:PEP-CTERM sorting domain-containing protein [Rhodospirillales bacterium]